MKTTFRTLIAIFAIAIISVSLNRFAAYAADQINGQSKADIVKALDGIYFRCARNMAYSRPCNCIRTRR